MPGSGPSGGGAGSPLGAEGAGAGDWAAAAAGTIDDETRATHTMPARVRAGRSAVLRAGPAARVPRQTGHAGSNGKRPWSLGSSRWRVRDGMITRALSGGPAAAPSLPGLVEVGRVGQPTLGGGPVAVHGLPQRVPSAVRRKRARSAPVLAERSREHDLAPLAARGAVPADQRPLWAVVWDVDLGRAPLRPQLT